MDPNQMEMDLHRQKQNFRSDHEKYLDDLWVAENQGEDFMGTMYEASDKRYDAKIAKQFPLTGGKDTAQNFAKRKAAEKSVKPEDRTVRLGRQGVEPISETGERQSQKDFTAKKLMEKPNKNAYDKAWLKKYWDVSDSPKGPTKPEHWEKIEKRAKQLAEAKKIQREGLRRDDNIVTTYDENQRERREAFESLFPEANVDEYLEKHPEKRPILGEKPILGEAIMGGLKGEIPLEIPLDIKIPEDYTNAGQMLKYLMGSGYSEEASRRWLDAVGAVKKGKPKK